MARPAFLSRRLPGVAALIVCLVTLLVVAGCGRPSTSRMAALKLFVGEDGLYRVTLGALQTARLGVQALESGNVSLTEGGEQVPYAIEGKTLTFYGRAPESRHTPFRPYILRAGERGATLREVNAAPGRWLWT